LLLVQRGWYRSRFSFFGLTGVDAQIELFRFGTIWVIDDDTSRESARHRTGNESIYTVHNNQQSINYKCRWLLLLVSQACLPVRDHVDVFA